MGIIDLFSKRQKRLRGEMPDVYQYDEIPQGLRVQIVQIIGETINTISARGGVAAVFDDFNIPEDPFQYIHRVLCKEHGRYKECLVDLNKAFESTMKTICKKRGWATQPKDAAKNLINICFQNNLLPTYLESEITALRTLLESGIPTIRNKNGGHGQGTDIVTVPAYIARYALNLTASTLLFLIEAEIG